MDKNDVLLTKQEAYAVCDVVAMTLFELIREDTEMDSLQWLRNVIHGYEKLCKYSGYIGVTEDDPCKESGCFLL